MVWILHNIDPSIFNVISDLVGQAAAGTLIFALSASYPYLVWRSVKKGNGVNIEALTQPPGSLLDAFMDMCKEFRHGDATFPPHLWLIIIFLTVSTFSHMLSDFFLTFENVEVSTQDAWLLGPTTAASSPTFYSLLGDTVTLGAYGNPVQRLLTRVDYIANGLSRYSCVPNVLSEIKVQDPFTTNGIPTFVDTFDIEAISRPIPITPQVECMPWYSFESNAVVNTMKFFETHQSNITDAVLDMSVNNTFVPSCEYEREIQQEHQYKDNDQQDLSSPSSSWRVLSRTRIRGDDYATDDSFFGYAKEEFSWKLVLSPDETAQPIDRRTGFWQLGRRIRDNLILVMGGDSGLEIELEFSVLGWPIQDLGVIMEKVQKIYPLSSWSRTCPTFDGGSLSVIDYSSSSLQVQNNGGNKPSGCIINWSVICNVFPEDSFHLEDNTLSGRECIWPHSIDVILLENIEIDPQTLAVYMGTTFRNDGYLASSQGSSNVAVNSIAAAYLVTREVVNGALPLSDIRPAINGAYVVLMLLPLLFAIPLVAVWLMKPKSRLPKSTWDSIVFGHREAGLSKLITQSNTLYPDLPPRLKFGFLSDGHLGLGSSFIRKRDLPSNTARALTNHMGATGTPFGGMVAGQMGNNFGVTPPFKSVPAAVVGSNHPTPPTTPSPIRIKKKKKNGPGHKTDSGLEQPGRYHDIIPTPPLHPQF